MDSRAFSRRDFVRNVAVAGSAVTVGGLLTSCDEPPTSHLHQGTDDPALARGAPTVRNPLRVPRVVSPNGLTLTAAPGQTTIIPGKSTTAWLYNGQFPGPTIESANGGPWPTDFVNGLAQPSITHWHGLLAHPDFDGHPADAVDPGQTFRYQMRVAQRAALNWYHPHPHMMTGEQVYRGLAGAFLVRDDVDSGLPGNTLGLPTGGYELPLIIRDASFDSVGNFKFGNSASGFFGDTPLVNGTYAPNLDVNRGIYRFRLLNGCNARVLRLVLSNGAPFTLIGNDGGLLDRTYAIQEIVAAPGERFDLLVDFRELARGATLMLRELDAKWDVLQFTGTGVAGAGSPLEGTLSAITPLVDPRNTRRFTFDGMRRINGKVYDMSATEFTVPFGTTERWTFVSNGNGPHPVHVHGAHFQVERRTGGRGRLYDWERGWKDTVLVNDGETVDVLIRFVAHRGMYVMHCHQLAHEDAGMMANFMVV